MEYKGKSFVFNESPQIQAVIQEMFSDNYKIFERNVPFEDGDVVLDIGANEGVFSIMLAKLFPNIHIVSFEPVSSTFYKMLKNIASNGVTNIRPINAGIAEKKGTVEMVVCDTLSGGSSGVQQQYDPTKNHKERAYMTTLDGAIDGYTNFQPNKRVKLMKMDIEGMEYESIYASTMLDKVDYFVGEFHINSFLISKGYDIKELATYVGSKTNLIFYETMRMAE